MPETQAALAPVLPVEDHVEFDAGCIVREPQGLFDRPLRRFDAAMDDDVAVCIRPFACFRPFQIGDLVFAGRLEDAVARVPVGLQRDVVEVAVCKAAERGARMIGEVNVSAARPRRRSRRAVTNGVVMSMWRA